MILHQVKFTQNNPLLAASQKLEGSLICDISVKTDSSQFFQGDDISVFFFWLFALQSKIWSLCTKGGLLGALTFSHLSSGRPSGNAVAKGPR